MLNKDLTKENAIWLMESFAIKRNGRIDGSTMDNYFVPARKYMTGKPTSRPGCGCHFKAYAAMTNSMFSQHEEAIKTIAYPPKTKTRAKRKTT